VADQALIARSRTLAKLALGSAVLLVALVLLLLFVVDHTTVSETFLILWGLFLLLSAIILGVALAYVFMTRGLKGAEKEPLGETVRPAQEQGPALPPEIPPNVASSVAPEVALRLLSGDERRLYWRVVEAGGAILQKDLVGTMPFSGSKITRLLDRLEIKGLIERERHGMTNRVRLSEAWQAKP